MAGPASGRHHTARAPQLSEYGNRPPHVPLPPARTRHGETCPGVPAGPDRKPDQGPVHPGSGARARGAPPGDVRANGHPAGRRGSGSRTPPVAGRASARHHEGPPEFLEECVRRCAEGNAREISEAPLARGSADGDTDAADKAAPAVIVPAPSGLTLDGEIMKFRNPRGSTIGFPFPSTSD